MNKTLSDMTGSTSAGFDFLIPIVLCIACMIWWRRVKHWSFGVLSLALILYWLPELFSYLDAYTHPQESFTPGRILFYTILAFFQRCVAGTLMLTGGLGLIVAGRKK